MDISEKAEAIQQNFKLVKNELAKIIVGHDTLIRHVFTCLLCGGHALIEGVPGLGKTLIVRSLSRILDLRFSRIQFTPDLMPADIVGTDILEEDEQSGRRDFRFQRGPVFANIVLVLIFMAGGLAVSSMIRENFPEFSLDMILITVPFPGADPEEVEEGISRKIEEALERMARFMQRHG